MSWNTRQACRNPDRRCSQFREWRSSPWRLLLSPSRWKGCGFRNRGRPGNSVSRSSKDLLFLSYSLQTGLPSFTYTIATYFLACHFCSRVSSLATAPSLGMQHSRPRLVLVFIQILYLFLYDFFLTYCLVTSTVEQRHLFHLALRFFPLLPLFLFFSFASTAFSRQDVHYFLELLCCFPSVFINVWDLHCGKLESTAGLFPYLIFFSSLYFFPCHQLKIIALRSVHPAIIHVFLTSMSRVPVARLVIRQLSHLSTNHLLRSQKGFAILLLPFPCLRMPPWPVLIWYCYPLLASPKFGNQASPIL